MITDINYIYKELSYSSLVNSDSNTILYNQEHILLTFCGAIIMKYSLSVLNVEKKNLTIHFEHLMKLILSSKIELKTIE